MNTCTFFFIQYQFHIDAIGTHVYEKGHQLYTEKDFHGAFTILLKAANKYNHSEAQSLLGHMCQNGKGTPHSSLKAIYWNTRADTASSCKNNGYLYLYGHDDVEKDYEKAMHWLTKAKIKGSISGTHLLASIYFKGKGVPIDMTQAFDLYKVAAHKGYRLSQYRVGCFYYYGSSTIRKDFEKAHYWFQEAASKGCSDSKCLLGDMYYFGKGVSLDLKKAAKWSLDAANDGIVYAICRIALMYRKGQGVSLDYRKSKEWYRMAANENASEGYSGLGSLYRDGYGVPKDGIVALSYYNKALSIDSKCPVANYEIGLLYWNGSVGINKDDVQSCIYFNTAANEGATNAFNFLGDARKFGKGLDVDYPLAMDWYKKGVGLTTGLSELNIGKLYLEGLGVNSNGDMALKWFQRARDMGSKDAFEYITELLERNSSKSSHKANTYDTNLESELIKERKAREIAERERDEWIAKAHERNNVSGYFLSASYASPYPYSNMPHTFLQSSSQTVPSFQKPNQFFTGSNYSPPHSY